MVTFIIHHGGGEQRRHAEHVGLPLAHLFDELVHRDVAPQVLDLEARALQHHAGEVLADVVQVPLDGAEQGPADLGLVALHDERFQEVEARVHPRARQ